MKVLANPDRLMILCQLSQRELRVGELEEVLGIVQPTLSQQLTVVARRESGGHSPRRQEHLLPLEQPGSARHYQSAVQPVLRFKKEQGMTIDWLHFTPWLSVAGGVLIGVASAAFILVNGRILGISGILGGLLAARSSDAGWRIAFLLGLLAAPITLCAGRAGRLSRCAPD